MRSRTMTQLVAAPAWNRLMVPCSVKPAVPTHRNLFKRRQLLCTNAAMPRSYDLGRRNFLSDLRLIMSIEGVSMNIKA